MMPTWVRPLSQQRFGTKAPRRKAGKKAGWTRLVLETLEDRVVPAFAVSAPASVIAGVAFPVTIAAQDQYGHLETNYNGSVTAHQQRQADASTSPPPRSICSMARPPS